jgi:hypothetical protein
MGYAFLAAKLERDGSSVTVIARKVRSNDAVI